MPNGNELRQLLSGRPVVITNTDTGQKIPLMPTPGPLRGTTPLKPMSQEGAALLQFLQAHGVDINPEDLYNALDEEVLGRPLSNDPEEIA